MEKGKNMAAIKVQKLEKSFGIHTVFKNISFELKKGERLALIGANGTGKSTLIKCIIGEEHADSGSVTIPAGETFGYLKQDVTVADTATLRETIDAAWQDIHQVETQLKETAGAMQTAPEDAALIEKYARLQERFEQLGGFSYEALSRKIVSGLGFTEADLDRETRDFSGGQKTRINLAKALVRRPEYLILDEPTNHLDMAMLEWLETYLLTYNGAVLIVSHDRYFLDKVATGILELENKTLTRYKGNYSRYVRQRDERHKTRERAYEKQQEHIKKTEEYIRKYKAGIKARQARGRQSQLDRLERLEQAPAAETLHFDFAPVEECGQNVLILDDICGGFPDRRLFEHLSLLLRRGEAASLIGPNGAGKTTLLKMIIGEKDPDSGFITLGSRVHIGYFAQEHTELHGNLSVLDELTGGYTLDEETARSILGRFLFRGDDVFKTVDSLSGGEKARLALLKLLLSGPNFLVLDEPTNHLDIPTREILEQALLSFDGTYLIVSHDRYFLDKITTRTLLLEHKKLKSFMGNYSYYKEKETEPAEPATEKLPSKPAAAPVKNTFPSPAAAAPVKENRTPVNTARLERAEMKIAELEATLKMYEVQMNDASPDDLIRLTKDYEETEAALAVAYEKWEELAP